MDLEQKFKEILQQSTDEEKETLVQILNGFTDKKRKNYDYITALLHMDGKFLGDDSFEVTMPITAFSNNLLGITHGGLIATLADSAMGYMLNQKLMPENKFCVTSEMKLNYLSPGTGSELIAKASIIKKGKQIIVTECKIYNDKNTLIAMASASFFVSNKK
jgi:uncharacterized protein (TIGR00369 family)